MLIVQLRSFCVMQAWLFFSKVSGKIVTVCVIMTDNEDSHFDFSVDVLKNDTLNPAPLK